MEMVLKVLDGRCGPPYGGGWLGNRADWVYDEDRYRRLSGGPRRRNNKPCFDYRQDTTECRNRYPAGNLTTLRDLATVTVRAVRQLHGTVRRRRFRPAYVRAAPVVSGVKSPRASSGLTGPAVN